MTEDQFSRILKEEQRKARKTVLDKIKSDILHEDIEKILHIIPLTPKTTLYLTNKRIIILKYSAEKRSFENIESIWDYPGIMYIQLTSKRLFLIFKKYFLTINHYNQLHNYKVDNQNIPQIRKLFRIIESLKDNR